MMPKSELTARLATRKAHRADAPVREHKGEPGKSWVAGDRADTTRYFGDKKTLSTWTGLVESQCRGNLRVKTRITEGSTR